MILWGIKRSSYKITKSMINKIIVTNYSYEIIVTNYSYEIIVTKLLLHFLKYQYFGKSSDRI